MICDIHNLVFRVGKCPKCQEALLNLRAKWKNHDTKIKRLDYEISELEEENMIIYSIVKRYETRKRY